MDKDKYNTYMKEYMLKRYHKRRLETFNMLGGLCAICGSVPTDWDLDHKDRNTKSFTIAKLWSISKERYLLEVSKCQILCTKCHNEKTLKEKGMNIAKGNHGTISSYRYCKCSLCKAAKAFYNKYHKHAPLAQLVEQQTSIGVTCEELQDENTSNSVNAEMPTPSQDSLNLVNKV